MIYHRKALLITFRQYLVQIYKDAILILLCVAPVLAGGFFKYGIPSIQKLLTEYLNLPELLTPYYLLFDLLLGSLTPILFCFAAAYVILGEIDDGISKYFAVTPVGKSGYLVTRLGLPAAVAFFVSIITLRIFMLSSLSLKEVILISFVSSLLGVIEALMVVSLSGNKVEGMAVSKLSGLFFLGLPAPFFLTGNIQFLLFFLPSFWVSKYALENNSLFILIGIVISIGWIMLLYCRFEKKIR